MLLNKINTVIGLELKIINENEFSGRYCVVNKQKATVNITDVQIVEGTLSSILNALPKTFPIALTLTGKGIIHKKMSIADEESTSSFQAAFPTIDRNDFYVQIFVEQQQELVSIIRRQTVDELIHKMRRSGLNIFVVSLGAMVSSPIWNQLNSYGQEILFDGHFIELDATYQWLSYHHKPTLKNEFQTKIGEQLIDERNVLAYASAFQLLLHQQLNLICADVDTIQVEFLQFTQNNEIKKVAFRFGIVLFISLLVSYLIFSHYNDKNVALSQKSGAYNTSIDQLNSLTKASNENEQLLKKLNWNGGFNYGFLINEIGESMPKQLQLNEISINEVQPETNISDAPTAFPVKINGITNNLTALNNWIFVLKQKPWIKTVRLLKYEESNDAEAYKFNIILIY